VFAEPPEVTSHAPEAFRPRLWTAREILGGFGLVVGAFALVVIGLGVYVASRIFSPREEEAMSRAFGPAWEAYRKGVMLPWL
jgi:protein-S-isoprenylcysteine O-methyltransferase Ste14